MLAEKSTGVGILDPPLPQSQGSVVIVVLWWNERRKPGESSTKVGEARARCEAGGVETVSECETGKLDATHGTDRAGCEARRRTREKEKDPYVSLLASH